MTDEPPTTNDVPLVDEHGEPPAEGAQWIDPEAYFTCSGVMVRSGVMVLEGVGPLPTLLFDFYEPDGTKMQTAALVCTIDELLPLTEIVRSAIKDAVREARKQP
jgi:hypothetical protein